MFLNRTKQEAAARGIMAYQTETNDEMIEERKKENDRRRREKNEERQS
jgi:hypothetical protein